MNERLVSSRALYGVVYTTSISSVYFALGVVAGRALGLTPLVFLIGGVFFILAAFTYIEASTLHQERGGSTVFSRYAFNELVSFVSGWAILLDYVILIAVTAVAATNYLGAFWSGFDHGVVELLVALGIIAAVALANVRGMTARYLRGRATVVYADLAVQALLVILGLFLIFHPGRLIDSIDLGHAPTVRNLLFALTIATVAFTGLEAAASLAGEVRATARELKLLAGPGAVVIVLVYVGISIVGIDALPVHGTQTDLGGKWLEAPLLGVASGFHPHWLAVTLKYLVAATAVAGLVAAANSSMLGLSRLGYALATNRQIPSLIGRLHPGRGTPFVLISLAALIAAGLAVPTDLDFLIGIYAFGAMIAFTIAHMSVIALRFRERDRERPYRIPFGIPVRGVRVPVTAVAGALLSALSLGIVVVLHTGARWVGLGWLLGGMLLYVVYRRAGGNPLLERREIPERALRFEPEEPEFGSILVPIFGNELDDDIMQTAGRLAGEEKDELDESGATIEAIWVFEVPLSLPLDARLPDPQVKRAREALQRAKAVGEEYEGVEVATAMVRARRTGQGIVQEARRRGVEAIVLAAEEASRVRGGGLFGGRGGPLDNYVGDVTRYVLKKAPCRVILTAPAATDGEGKPAAPSRATDGEATPSNR
jgi:APA family basic amino acid/polyamine antiporter